MIRLGISGLSAGLAAGFAWRAAGRTRWGAAPIVVAVAAAAALTGRSDRPGWSAMVVAGAIVTILAGAGAARLLADPSSHWGWVAAGALISVTGVWAGVPETGPALLVGGVVAGIAAAAAFTGARWTRAAGWGIAAVLGWAALSGAAGSPWAALGGTLCAGVAPWAVVSSLLPSRWGSRGHSPWLLGAHLVLVLLAARWIAVDPDAGWGRVAIVAFAGFGVSVTARRQA